MHPTLPPEVSWPMSIPFRRVGEEYLKKKAEKWSPGWYTRVEDILNKFCNWLGDRLPDPSAIREYEEHCIAIGRLDSKMAATLSHIYTFGIRHGWAARNPFREFRSRPIPREKRVVRKVIPHDYWERVAKIACYMRLTWYPLWVGCYETGLDRASIATLRWSHINRQTWMIKRIRQKMETRPVGGEVEVAIIPTGRFYECVKGQVELLKARGSMATEEEEMYVFPRLAKRFFSFPNKDGDLLRHFFTTQKLPQYTFHDLRYTRITAMVNAGVPAKVAMKIAGHSSEWQLYQYVGTSPEQVRDAAIKSNQFSRLCPSQTPPSSSAPTANPTLFGSTSEPPPSSSPPLPSLSPTTSQPRATTFAEWRKRMEQRTSEVTAAVPIARETGRLSLTEVFGDDPPEIPSSSSSPSDSSLSRDFVI